MKPVQIVAAESTLTAAVAPKKTNFGKPRSLSERNTEEDITAWLEEQEEAEMALLMEEMAGRQHRAQRHAAW